MILTVALNAALDVTYTIDGEIRGHATHRVTTVAETAGGKALNTARILHGMGESVLATGLLGGHTGQCIAERIPHGLRHSFVTVDGESRRALVVADPVDATGFWEPGPQVSAREWQEFREHFRGLLKVATVAVLSGSLPRGLSDDAYGQLIADASAAGVATVLDCDGAALLAALPMGPDVVKPNAAELAAAVPDVDTTTAHGVQEAAARLRAAGAKSVVASRGRDGLIALTSHGDFAAVPPVAVSGNPTGAGDACVAALARGIAHQTGWRTRLIEAVALSCAAVKSSVAGNVEPGDYLHNRHHVELKEL